MAIPIDARRNHEADAAYCGRCLSAVSMRAEACGHCDQPFIGAGQFQRMPGPPPSRDFAFLFSGADAPSGALAEAVESAPTREAA